MIEFTFDANGYLTPNDEPVFADKACVSYHFGSASELRRDLWNAVETLMDIISLYLLPVTEVWIDGSFISLKTDPKDVDVIIFISQSAFESIRDTLDKVTISFVHLDVKWVPMLDGLDDLSLAINALERMKWFV